MRIDGVFLNAIEMTRGASVNMIRFGKVYWNVCREETDTTLGELMNAIGRLKSAGMNGVHSEVMKECGRLRWL